VVEVSLRRARGSSRCNGVRASNAPDAATQNADTLVLAVKPQDLRPPAAGARRLGAAASSVVSIAAGVRSTRFFRRWLGGHRKLVRWHAE